MGRLLQATLTVLLLLLVCQQKALCQIDVFFSQQDGYIVTEGDTVVVVVETSESVTADETVMVTTMNGTATAADDFIGISTSITIFNGTSSSNFSIEITNDTIGEETENFTVELSAPSSGLTITQPSLITIEITSDVMIGFNPTSYNVSEGDTVNLTVELSGDTLSIDFTVDFSIQNGTAFADIDFTPPMESTITIAGGTTSGTISIATIDDNIGELTPETFTVQLSNLLFPGAILHSSQATVEISADVVTVGFSPTNYTVSEGEAIVTLTVVLIGDPPTVNVTVDVATMNGSATEPDDYISLTSTITFDAGETQKDFNVTIVDDSVGEDSESFSVVLDNPSSGLTLASGLSVAGVEISADVVTVGFDETSYTVSEGEAIVTLSVVLIGDTPTSDVTVDMATVNGNATEPDDYIALTSTITFATGETQKDINVTIVDDSVGEDSESFSVVLDNPSSGLTLASSLSVATVEISADVVYVGFSQSSYTVSEGDTVTLTMVLTGDPPTSDVTVDLMTMDGTATVPGDFEPLMTTITFSSGSASQTFDITITDDTEGELVTENFTVVLSNPSTDVAIIMLSQDSQATVEISPDEIFVGFSQSNYTVSEGDTMVTLTVELTGDTPTSDVTVDVMTMNGNATEPDDYIALTSTITFTAGETQKDINVTIVDDSVGEDSESFSVELSNPSSGLTLASGLSMASVEISADVVYVGFDETSYTVSEGEAIVTLSVVLIGDTPTSDVTVDVATMNGSATASDDYTAFTSTINFTAGETQKDINVTIVDDSVGEDSESFSVELGNPSSGLTLASGLSMACVEISADVVYVGFSQSSYTVSEGDDVTLTVVLTGDPPTSDVTVDVMTMNGTAAAPDDYMSLTTTITFTGGSGNTQETLMIQTNDDILMETSETFSVSLSNIVSTDVIAMIGTNNVAEIEITDLDSGMLPEPVTNLTVDVFPENNSVLVQWTDTENIFDPNLVYFVTVDIFARDILLTSFSSNVTSSTSFSMSDGFYIVSGVVANASVQVSNNVGPGLLVEAIDTAAGVFAPAVVGFQVMTVSNVSPPSVTLTWDNSYDEVPPDSFQLSYTINKLSGQPPQSSMETLTLTQANFSLSSSQNDYSYTLTDLLFHTTYDFNLTAVYGTDESSIVTETHSTVEGTPSMVQNVMFTLDATMGSFNSTTNRHTLPATISWSEPTEPNGVITTYEYSISVVNTNETIATETTTGSVTSARMSIVARAFTDYVATVVAFTSAGASDPASSDQVLTPQAAPSAPQSVTVTSITSNSAVVSWAMPESSNGNIQEYIVRLVGSEVTMFNVSSQTFSLPLMDLSPHTSYTVEVSAVTIEEGLSSSSSFTTPQDVPELVQNLVATFVEDGSETYDTESGLYDITVNISWSEPSVLNGELSHYSYRIISQQGGNALLTAMNTTETSVSPRVSVMPFTSFIVFVRAVTGGGVGVEASMTITSPEAAPTEVLNLAISANSNTDTLLVTWDTPQRPNGMVSYTLNLTYTDLATSESVFISSTVRGDNDRMVTMTFSESGLEPYAEYSAIVVAMTTGGESDPVTETVTTDEGASTPPLNLAAVTTNISVSLTWSPPADANGVIFQYTVQLNDSQPDQVLSPSTMIELDELLPFTTYSVTVRADTGSDGGIEGNTAVLSFDTEIGIPTEPQAVEVTPDGQNRSLLVSWSPPSTLNAPSVNYTIELTNVMTSVTTNQMAVTETSTVFSSLLPYTQYTARVQGCSSAGCGPFSESVSQFTLEEAPSIPLGVTAVETSPNSISLSWTAPASPNGVIRYYLVTYGDSLTVNTTNDDTSITISQLTPFTNYTVTVVAITVAMGGDSEPVIVRTDETAPSEPLAVMATPLSSTEISVEWTEPDTLNGVIRNYQVTYYITDDQASTMMMVNTTNDATSIMISNLTPFTNYTVTVVAVTVAMSGASDPATVRTDEAAPSKPLAVTATSVSSAEISVVWTEPDTLNGVIRNYQVTYYITDDQANTMMMVNTNSDATNITIDNLTPFTNYTVTVVAVTVAMGEASDPATVTTAQAAPSAPVITMTSNTSSTTIFVQWDPPSNPNGVVTGYLVTYSIMDEGPEMNQTVNESSTTLRNLEKFTTYTISVRARTVELGEMSNSVEVTTDEDIPSEPTSVTASEINSTAVMVTWASPSSHNGVLLDFTLSYRPFITNNTNDFEDSPSLTFEADSTIDTYMTVLSNLEEFTKYEIRIIAATRIGTGPPTIVTVVTDPDSAGPPSFSDARTIDSTSIEVMWGFPSDPRGIIEGYIITYRVDSSDNEMDVNITLDTPNDMSNQTYVIDMLMPFTNYLFRVSAYSFSDGDDPFQLHLGEDTAIGPIQTAEAAPSQPRDFQLENIPNTPTMLTATWSVPDTRNGVITSYSVYCNTSSSPIVVSGDASTATIPNLLPFTYYECSVSANTSAGEGDRSNTDTAQTVEAVPSEPVNFMVEVLTARSVSLSWSMPDTPNGVITGYVLTYSIVEGGNNVGAVTVNYTAGDISATLTDLTPNKLYMFSLRASTSAGLGDGISDTAMTLQAAPDQPPQNVVGVNTSSTSLLITWEEPPLEFQNGDITTYIITYNTSSVQMQINTSDTTIELMNLEIFTDYKIRVSAVTVEEGPQSDAIVVRTDSDTPSAPQTLSYTNSSSSSVNITWSPPLMENGIIEGYILQYTLSSPMNVTDAITDTMYTLNGLAPHTTYTMVVFALTDQGAGSPSEELLVYTLEDRPEGAPQNFSAETINPQTVTLTWSPPDVPNGIITHYELTFTNESYTSDTAQIVGLSVTLGGLNEFTNYTFTVAAVTSAGSGPNESLVITTGQAAPSAPPSNLEASNSSSTSIFISWDPPPPTDQNGEIIHYVITYSIISVVSTDNTITTTSTSINITDLEIFTFYNISVSAFTVDIGPPATDIVQTDSSTPTAPRSVTEVNTSPTTITLSWIPPDPPNGEIEFYSIEYSSVEDGTVNEEPNIDESPFTLTGLMEYVNYTIVVYAHTDKGRGDGSDPIVVRTDEHFPDEPTSFNVVVTNSTALSVTWGPPLDPNGVIISYHLYVSIDPQDSSYFSPTDLQDDIVIGADERSYVLGELHPFIAYQLQLAAETSVGVGNRTPVMTEITLMAAPSEGVRELNVQVDSPTAVNVSWLPPELDSWNGQLTNYNISWRPQAACGDGGPIQLPVSGDSVSLSNFTNPDTPRGVSGNVLMRESILIENLEEFVSYTFSVTVATTEGNNPPELTATGCVRTQAARPSRAPRNVSFTILSNTSAVVAWTDPPLLHHNGIISSYTVWLTDRNDTNSSMSLRSNETSMSLDDLIPFTVYAVEVAAVNQEGPGPMSTPIDGMTQEGLPEAPRSVKVTETRPTEIDLVWEPPNNFFGNAQPYQIDYTGTKGDPNTMTTSATEIQLDGLIGDSTYEIFVRARSGAGLGMSTKVTATLPRGATPKIEVTNETMVIVPVLPSDLENPITPTSIKIEFSIIGQQQQNGDAEKYRIIVQKQPSSNPNVGTYYQSNIATENFVKYPALEVNLNGGNKRKKRATDEPMMQTATVGGSDECGPGDEVCNGPLEPGTKYRIGYQLFSGNESTEYEFEKVFTTSTRSSLALVVGVVIVVLVLLIIVVLVVIIIIVVVYKRKSGKLEITKLSNGDQKLIPRDNGEKGGIPFLRPSDPGIVPIQEMKQQTPGAANPRFVAPSHTNSKKIFLKEYSTTIQDMLSDTAYKFSEEYEHVTEVGLEHAKEDSLMAENRAKNRYTNILAYDHSRVKLSFVDDEPGSDYINASYIPGSRLRRAYIATQGPLPATFDDFWRMVWEQNTHLIVMLTQLVERGRTKCHRYWPGTEPSVYGDIAVEMISEKEKEDWTIREFKLSVADRNPRLVRHFQFTSWPDHGVPDSPVAAIDFVNTVRTYVEVHHGPLVVHCSAGVGRTGCFIALDTLQQFVVDHDWVDIFGLACEMRQHRNHMIQTEAQYVFIHKALQEIIDSMTSYNSGPNFSQTGYSSLFVNQFTQDSTQMSDYYGDCLSEETHM